MNKDFKIPDEIRVLQEPQGFWDAVIKHSKETGCTYAEAFDEISDFFESVFGYRKYSEIRSMYSSVKKCKPSLHMTSKH